ncbi:MAG: VWA domain-containing protein [Elusimicrobiaceae bacterium]|nr:VWA domain-containing protein [Elusimicrobiaceae bacterium]MBP5617227.1 VWA domain-containing protein [Elusimicrobiaceae bacterium]
MKLFAHPIFLLYFVPAALAVGIVLWWGKRRTNKLLNRLFGTVYPQLTKELRPVSKWRNVFLLGSFFFLFAALAGPQWGLEITQAQGNFAQTVLAVDVSASMRAQDVPPDRLQSAKQMLQMLVSHLKQERIGIIAFTSQAFIQCPITTDTEALNYFIRSLQPDMLPVPGTSLAAPVQLAARMLAKYPGQKALILLTDGEDHSPQEIAAAQKSALENAIRIIAVGIGTAQGALIPAQIDANGQVSQYKKDKTGKTVVSKLDEASLAQLAQATGGVYIPYTNSAQVAKQIENSLQGLDKSTSSTGKHVAYKNRYAIALVLALLCLLIYWGWPRGKKPLKKGKI